MEGLLQRDQLITSLIQRIEGKVQKIEEVVSRKKEYETNMEENKSKTGLEKAPNEDELKGYLVDLLKKKPNLHNPVPIFCMIAGSWAFNLNVATSDKDYFGIYVASINDVLGLYPLLDTIDQHDPDFVSSY